MPELPEVEIITRELARALVGKKLSKFSVFDAEKISRPRLALPQRIISVRRHGKYIACDTDKGLRCLLHLRMTGKLLFKTRDKRTTEQSKLATGQTRDKKEKSNRAEFSFLDGSLLKFLDTRRFGTVEWLKKEQPLPQLGPEPLSRNFDARKLGELLHGRSRAIKSALLDQRLIAGLGNIYADESLWTAKIHPLRKSSTLKEAEIGRLTRSIKQVLRRAIKKGGFTLRDYRRIDGRLGSYQHSRKVYAREDEKCLRCRTKIRRIRISGRSSYFCPRCQK